MTDYVSQGIQTALSGLRLGKYRGRVKTNKDEAGLGWIEVTVPTVLGKETRWAAPCVPFAGEKVGLFAMPPEGANVWVEFEQGDIDRPIWSGCFWEEGEVPERADEKTLVLATAGATIVISDDGEIEIETSGGTKLILTGDEIKLEAPSIKQAANGGATELSSGGFDAQNGALKVV